MDDEAPEHHHAAANIIMLVKGLLKNMEEDGLKKAVDALTQDVGGYTDQLRSTVFMMLDQLPRGWWVDANLSARAAATETRLSEGFLMETKRHC